MIRSLTSALLCLTLPTQALALSCAPWNAVSTYRAAAEAEERYVIALGSFFRTGPDQVTEENAAGPDPYSYAAYFAGDMASRVGFRTPIEFPVQVNVTCVASWCGTPPGDGETVLAIMQVDDNRDYSLQIGACPFWAVTYPDEADLDQITTCMRSGC